jgi:hypothetical protein
MTHDGLHSTWMVRYAPASYHCGVVAPDARKVYTVTVDGATLAEVFELPAPRPNPAP